MTSVTVPTHDRLFNPVMTALRSLGGSGSIQEIYDKVVEQERFSEEMLSVLHEPDRSNQTEIAYRMAWARSFLKKYGVLENSTRGIWALTSKASGLAQVDRAEVLRVVRAQTKKIDGKAEAETTIAAEVSGEEEWKQKLFSLLTKKVDLSAFERLVQRLLRESGFTQVEVTGRSGDGGIDGKGIARVHGLLSFHVLFQCKRHSGSVGASDIRDFRGAMVGRSDKGLFITTGTFTPAAVKEATRDGAPAIDLIDGSNLADKLKEFRLGITTASVEVVRIDEGWFDSI